MIRPALFIKPITQWHHCTRPFHNEKENGAKMESSHLPIELLYPLGPLVSKTLSLSGKPRDFSNNNGKSRCASQQRAISKMNRLACALSVTMGSHSNSMCRVRELRRLEFAESTERDTVLLSVRLWRRLRSPSTARRAAHSSMTCSYACAFCGKNTVKRSCVGIWECKKCGKVVAGGAWTVATPAAMTVRSSIQRLRRSKVEA